ncbi:hypothetical protein CDAR_504181 [Caerostris darwini]|uniref:Uncharacterized protein n=1 Tax=Caerostris darwini TaxID=1538125 RepID=A0AAV4S1I5_9ARAC|nr:hypothetical protein CDAR_504181 [Caerostris darwini]
MQHLKQIDLKDLFITVHCGGGSDDVIGLTFYRNRRVEKVGHEQRSRMTTDMRPCENALDVKGHYLTRLFIWAIPPVESFRLNCMGNQLFVIELDSFL